MVETRGRVHKDTDESSSGSTSEGRKASDTRTSAKPTPNRKQWARPSQGRRSTEPSVPIGARILPVKRQRTRAAPKPVTRTSVSTPSPRVESSVSIGAKIVPVKRQRASAAQKPVVRKPTSPSAARVEASVPIGASVLPVKRQQAQAAQKPAARKPVSTPTVKAPAPVQSKTPKTEPEPRAPPKPKLTTDFKVWLTPLGIRVIDESYRAPDGNLPKALMEDFFQFDTEANSQETGPISHEEMKQLIDDERLRIERVFMYGSGCTLGDFIRCEIFENLHLHPCEELHVCRASVKKEHIPMILKCTSLRVLKFFDSLNPETEDFAVFKKLPNLEGIRPDSTPANTDIPKQMAVLRSLPNLKAFDLRAKVENFTESQINAAVECIESRKNSIERAFVQCNSPKVFKALAECPNLKSFEYQIDYADNVDANLKAFLSHPNVQKNLEHFRLWDADVKRPVYDLLAKCESIRWLDLYKNFELTSSSLKKMITKNAAHIVDVNVGKCPKVTADVLDTLAVCKAVKFFDVRASGVDSLKALRYKDGPSGAYVPGKRKRNPNWRALLHHDFTDSREAYYDGDPGTIG